MIERSLVSANEHKELGARLKRESISEPLAALDKEAWTDARKLWSKTESTASEGVVLDFSTGEVISKNGRGKGGTGSIDHYLNSHFYDAVDGDTMSSIAGRFSPKDASTADIDTYIRALRLVNNLKDGESLVGKHLRLPTLLQDQSIVYWRDDDYKVTLFSDGKELVQNRCGANYLTSVDDFGRTRIDYSGSGLKQGFRLVIDAGERQFYSSEGLVLFSASSNSEIMQEHTLLLELGASEIDDPIKLAMFESDLCQFEFRSNLAKLPDAQVIETYKQIERLLRNGATDDLSQSQLNDIASQILSNAANPSTVDQGNHPTCNVSTVESCVYTFEPATAAKLVTDVALTGQFISKDGITVSINERPHDSAKSFWVADGQRTHASEIFQMTAVNLFYQEYGNSNVRYELFEPDGKPDNKFQSERLTDYTSATAKVIGTDPGLNTQEIALVYAAIVSQVKEIAVLEQNSQPKDQAPGLHYFKTESELLSLLQEAKSQGRLPLVLRVDSRNDPFFTDRNLSSLSGGNHVVTVTDIVDGATPTVTVDNQWGTANDHLGSRAIDLHTLYLATLPVASDTLATFLRQDVQALQAAGALNVSKELQALLHEKAAHKIDSAEYFDELKQLFVKFNSSDSGSCSTSDDQSMRCKEDAAKLLNQAVADLPAHDALNFLQFEREQGWVSLDQYENQLVKWGKKFSRSESELTPHDNGKLNGHRDPLRKGREVFDSMLAKLPEPVLRRILFEIERQSQQQINLGAVSR